MYNERRLELDLEGGGPRSDDVLLLGVASAFKQRGQCREPIASIGPATIGLLSVAHHQVAGRVVELVGQHVHDGLVRGHHDGRVRDLPDQLRSEATVQSRLALLLPHRVDRLPEAAVLVSLLAQPGPGHLVRVRHHRRDRLGGRPRRHKLQKVARSLVVAGAGVAHLVQFLLERLVDHKVDDRLGDSDVAGGDALVEPGQTLRRVDPAHALRHGLLRVGVVVQLEARLDEPDRVGERGGHETGAGRTHDVHERRVGRDDANRVQRIFGLGVRTKVDRTGRRHADNVRPEALKQGATALGLDDVLQALPDRDRLDRRREATLRDGEDRWPAAAQQRASAYPLSGMVLGGVAVAAQMLVRSARRRRGQLTDAVMIGHDTRRHADERGGRTLETRFDHFQRACYHGASSTCDTSSEKMN